MTRKRYPRDPVEGQIEAALDPGRFVEDRGCFSFVEDLEEVENDIAALVSGAPSRAVGLYEAFLAGCYEKANEVDDSSGSFGMFVGTLFCGWVKARQAAGVASEETAARLLAWMDDDPFGFCFELEKDLAGALDRPGRAALVGLVHARLDAAPPPAEGSSRHAQDYARHRCGQVLRALHLAQKDIEAYVQLAEESGLGAEDCHAIATMLIARRRPEEALSWAERGIEVDLKDGHRSSAGGELARLKRQLLKKLGREDEALDAAWAGYQAWPSTYTYAELMKFVPRAERAAWHARAIEAAAGTDLHSHIDLLLKAKESERLAELVGRTGTDALEAVSPYALEPAARKLASAHPGAAAALWRAMGMSIVKAKKSKSYGGALRYLEQAKRCYEKAGLQEEWQQVVDKVRAEHHRKTGFMSGFEELVSGTRHEEPPFLERAKSRWGGG